MENEMCDGMQTLNERKNEHTLENIIGDSIPEYKIIGGTDGKKQ